MANTKNYQVEVNRVFSYTNPKAKVVIVGITPGVTQDKDRMSQSDYDKLSQAEKKALIMKNAFAGRMRPDLNKMMNAIRVNEVLGLADCAELWEEANFDMVEITSLLKNPVCEPDGKMFNKSEDILKSEQLTKELYNGIVADMKAMKDLKMIVASGEPVAAVLVELQKRGDIPVVPIAPITHPSGANQGRVNMYLGVKEASNAIEGIWSDMKAKAEGMVSDCVLSAKTTYSPNMLFAWLENWEEVRNQAKKDKKAVSAKEEKAASTLNEKKDVSRSGKSEKLANALASYMRFTKHRHTIELKGATILHIQLHRLSDYDATSVEDLDQDMLDDMRGSGGFEEATVLVGWDEVKIDNDSFSGDKIQSCIIESLEDNENETIPVQVTTGEDYDCFEGMIEEEHDKGIKISSLAENYAEGRPRHRFTFQFPSNMSEEDVMDREIDTCSLIEVLDSDVFDVDTDPFDEDVVVQIDALVGCEVGAMFDCPFSMPSEVLECMVMTEGPRIGRFALLRDRAEEFDADPEEFTDEEIASVVQGDWYPGTAVYTHWYDACNDEWIDV